MYPTSGATIRGDINIKVEQAASADKHYIATRVMPPVPVDIKSGTYPKLEIAGAELMSVGSTIRTRSGSYGEVSRKWTTDTYDCIDRGLEEPVDDTDVRDMRRFFNLEMTAARLCLLNMQLDHEDRVATAIFNTTTFGAATNSAVAYTEANIATISFVADILAAIERIADNGQQADTIVIPSPVFNRVRRATPTVNFVTGSVAPGRGVTAETLAAAFADHGIRQVLIGRARKNTAKKGQAKSISQVWANTYVWVGAVNPNAGSVEGVTAGGAGFTLYWNQDGGLYTSETYRNENRRSNMVRVRQNTAEKVVDATAGTLIATQYS